MKIKSLLLLGILFFTIKVYSHEGMWIPTLLQAIEEPMQAEGLRLSAEDIYSINHSSLKDAIVHFGGGCTAEMISDQGLLLTNYHCGYSQIQSHSTVDQDYLTDGFWAGSKEEELRNPGLTATFIQRIEDVTAKMLDAMASVSAEEKEKALIEMAALIEEEASENGKYKAKIVPFYYGAEYYMIVTKTYNDVRLVGAPPSAVGKFGGDTDNWIWPRHTGDFSLFRIYADAENEPSAISDNNKSYKPLKSLQISAAGVEEGDFTMVYGFPGRTEKYLVSSAVDYVENKENPAKIAMREATLSIMEKSMASDDKIRIQYAAKQSRVSNAWKKWIGQNFGLKQQKVLDQKIKWENEFQSLVDEDPEMKTKYGDLLNKLQLMNDSIESYKMARSMFIEYVYYGPELIRFINKFDKIVQSYEVLEKDGKLEEEKEKLMKATDSFFKNYHQPTDKLIFDKLTEMYISNVQTELLALSLRNPKARKKLSNNIYVKSIFSSKKGVKDMLKKIKASNVKKLKSDPGFKFASEVYVSYFTSTRPNYSKYESKISDLMRQYVEAQRILFPDNRFSPDANSTLRLTYGKAEGSRPRDGVIYRFYTTSQGILDKYVPGSKDFDLPKKLVNLLENKDFGSYAHDDGTLRVCFTGSNHTSGGNSGSPTLNGKGQLIGLNFDRSWESTMSDIMFAPDICRNIMVDIRYVLFVIDKYAGADHLIKEMDIVY